MKPVGNNILKYMSIKGFKSQAELARKSKISPQGLSDIVTGKKSPNIITLSKIASALGVNTRDLLENDSTIREAEEYYDCSSDLTPSQMDLINWATSPENFIFVEFAEKLSEIFSKEEVLMFDVYTFAKIFKMLKLEGQKND